MLSEAIHMLCKKAMECQILLLEFWTGCKGAAGPDLISWLDGPGYSGGKRPTEPGASTKKKNKNNFKGFAILVNNKHIKIIIGCLFLF